MKTLAGCLVIALAAGCATSAATSESKDPLQRRMLATLDLNGVWKDLKDGTFVRVAQVGDQLLLTYDGTERTPIKGSITAGRRVAVEFEDGCCTGSFLDDSTIHWSNNTMWQRMQRMVNVEGQWRDERGLVVKIDQEGDELSLTYAAGRAPVSGRAVGGEKLQVAFDRDCCTGVVSDNKTIRWSNKAVWQRQTVGP